MELYLYLFLIVFVINALPAFMPPSWLVLALFAVHFQLEITWVVLLGVVASTLGRTVLYSLARHFVQVLSIKQRRNMEELGELLDRKRQAFLALLLSFSVLPLPSNNLYIAAGLAKFDKSTITTAFFLGRLLNYTFLVSASTLTASQIQFALGQSITSAPAVLLQFSGLILLYFATEISWKDFFHQAHKDFLAIRNHTHL